MLLKAKMKTLTIQKKKKKNTWERHSEEIETMHTQLKSLEKELQMKNSEILDLTSDQAWRERFAYSFFGLDMNAVQLSFVVHNLELCLPYNS